MCHGTIVLKMEAKAETIIPGALKRLTAAMEEIAGEVKKELTELGYHDVDTVDIEKPFYRNGIAQTSETITCSGLGESGEDINAMQAELEGVVKRFVDQLSDLAEIVQNHSLADCFTEVTAWLEEPYADGEEDFDEDGNPVEDEGGYCGC